MYNSKLNFILLGPICMALLSCATDPKYLVKKPYLFEVSKNQQTAYFFGSIHVGVSIDDLPSGFWVYLDRSDILLTETSPENDLELRKNILDDFNFKMQRQEGALEMKSLLKSDEYAKIKARLMKLQAPTSSEKVDEILTGLSPFGLLMMLHPSLAMQDALGPLNEEDINRIKSGVMLDDQIRSYAVDHKKNLDQLDSYDSLQWVKCLAGKDEDNLKKIRHLISHETTEDKTISFASEIQNYRNGQIGTDEYKLLPDCMLVERNVLWMKKIREALEYHQTPFFVVGVLHLVADQGSLLELLKAEGFFVRRIDSLDAD